MKRLICLLAACLSFFTLSAQTDGENPDSLLTGPAFWERMPSTVRVNQSELTMQGFDLYRAENVRKMYNGYRVRIFYSNSQSARNDAEAVINDFCVAYPDIQYYFEYDNPYFKVTVGNYGSRLAAEKALRLFKQNFADAIVVKQKFRFPEVR